MALYLLFVFDGLKVGIPLVISESGKDSDTLRRYAAKQRLNFGWEL
jgi:hypothetical protein